MSDLRKYINLVKEQDDLQERRIRNPFKSAPTSPKVGAEVVGKDGLIYQWQGRQWVQKAGQAGGKGRIATRDIAQQLTAQELKSRGNLITRIIKKNPKVSAALAAVLGIKTASTVIGDTPRDQDQTPPAQSGQPADSTPGQSGQTATTQAAQEDLTAIKAEIDALIKELDSSTDANIKKELARIKDKLNPKPRRWADNPSIIE
jgi:hypothetical protein